MEENNTPSNLEVKGDPSVTLTIRLIMQGKVSLFMAFLISSFLFVFIDLFIFFFFLLFFCFGHLTISIIVDFTPKNALFLSLRLLVFLAFFPRHDAI